MRLAVLVAALAVGVMAALAGGAFADQVANNLDTTVDSTPEAMLLTVGGSNGSVGYFLNTLGTDAKSGCNLTGSGSQLIVDLSSSDTSVATLGSSSVTITACNGTPVAVSVHPVAAGSSTITATFHSVTTTSAANTSSDYTMDTATFTVNVSNPAPTNHAPSTPGAPTVAAGTSPRADGNFTVSWTASTDPDSGDSVTYTLEQHDASTSTWSPVASGLTTNSYSLGSGGNPAEAEGTWSYRVKAVDNHGAASSFAESDNLVKVDTSNPNAPTGHESPAAGYTDGSSNAWYKDGTTVSFTGNGDPDLGDGSAGSGVASVTGSQAFDSGNVNTDGSFSITGHATDNVGNASSGTTVSGYVDWQAPTVSITPTTGADFTDGSGNNWWNDSVSLDLTANDPAPSSGLATDPSQPLGPYTASGSIAAGTYTATDNVGHSGSNSAFAYNVDTAAPDVNCTVPNQSNWYDDNQTVTCTASDTGAGLANSADASFSLSTTVSSDHETDSAQTGSKTVYDNVGHHTTVGPYTFMIDREAPQLAGCDSPDGDWHGSNVTLYCTYTDGGSGPASQQVALTTSVDAGNETSNAAASAGSANACDAINNCAASPNDITGNKIDRKAPQLAGCDSPDGNWHASNVTLYCTYTDGGSGPASQQVALTTSVDAGNETSNAAASAGSANACDAINNCAASPDDITGNKIDRKAPVISDGGTSDAPTGFNGVFWWNHDVTVDFSATDGGSGVACTSPWTKTTSGEGNNVTVSSGNCADNAGNGDNAITSSGYHIDETKPTVGVTGVSNGAIYTLGSVPTAGCTTGDSLSGVATYATVSTSGGPVGSVTATCSGAADNAGNTNSTSVTYSVDYSWTGFFQPVNNPTDPAPCNTVKAGSAIPIKFSLHGYQGMSILATGSPNWTVGSCSGTDDAITSTETVTAGNSSLSYDATSDQYVYVWKTDKTWAGKSVRLTVTLADGTPHYARFTFTK